MFVFGVFFVFSLRFFLFNETVWFADVSFFFFEGSCFYDFFLQFG